MKITISFLFTTLIYLNSRGQINKPIKIEEIYITDSSQLKSQSDFIAKDSIFFQDSKYLVRKTCHGEWGGSVWFKNKKTQREHSCRATCPYFINKLRNKYYVTTNSFHMTVSTGIIEIVNPEVMTVYNPRKAVKVNGHVTYRAYSESETNSYKGAKYLADTTGIYTIFSFVSQSKLYHLMTGFSGGKIYIATFASGKYAILDTIPGASLFKAPKAVVTRDNHFLLFFSSDCHKGYVDVFDNRIKIFRYDKFFNINCP